MINYNSKDLFKAIFQFHKADTSRKLLPLIFLVCLYSFLITLLETHFLKFDFIKLEHLKNISLMHTLLGVVISVLMVFRTNTAYDRWWEGRKLWGALVNNARNLSLKLATLLPKDAIQERDFFCKIIPAYAYALHNHLKSEATRTALFEKAIAKGHLQDIDTEKHIPNQIAYQIFTQIKLLYDQKLIDGFELMTINAELQSLTDICGACERIKNTPIPFSYMVFIKKFIFTYVITLPIGYVFSLGYFVIPVVAFVFFVLGSLELIAEEIEDPFGEDHNDLPTKLIASRIEIHVKEIFE